jgi:purine catabolism regulator
MKPERSREGRATPRGAAAAAPRATPLTLVCAALPGEDLEHVAQAASDALGRPIAIVLPGVLTPVVWPLEAGAAEQARELVADAVRTLTRGSREGARRALLQALAAGPPVDARDLVTQARQLGFDLGAGAVAFCAQRPEDEGSNGSLEAPAPAAMDGTGTVDVVDVGADRDQLPGDPPALLAEVGEGRVLGLMPLSSSTAAGTQALSAALSERGMKVAFSAPRRDSGALHEALREAELMAELAVGPEALLPGQEATYRLLIGVLLRDPDELELLRAGTISSLEAYDRKNDAELLATLQAFLAHHGSTTETAEAMRLHRHTIGYRLARVHEVSGLSPYESDGRERLSLGLKADQILSASERHAQLSRT